jgi:hypothetical protein
LVLPLRHKASYLRLAALSGSRAGKVTPTMGKFDRRKSQKMTRRKGQRKKLARLSRRAQATRKERSGKKPAPR